MLKTIDRITGLKGSLVDYSVNSVTRGKDAIGEVTVRVHFNGDGGKIVTGKGASTDIIEASALAYLNALNRYLFEQRRTAETEKPTLRHPVRVFGKYSEDGQQVGHPQQLAHFFAQVDELQPATRALR